MKKSSLPIKPIKEIYDEVNELCGGKPAKPKINKDKVVAVIKWVDGTLIDSTEAIFYPCKYLIDQVEILEGPKVDNIKEVVSYEGIFCDIANENEEIIVKGKLEEV